MFSMPLVGVLLHGSDGKTGSDVQRMLKKPTKKQPVPGSLPGGLVADHIHVELGRGLDDVLHVSAVLFVRQACEAAQTRQVLITSADANWKKKSFPKKL